MEVAHKKKSGRDNMDIMSQGTNGLTAPSESTIPNRSELYEGEFELRKMDKVVKKHLIEVKRLQDEKTNLVMKFETNQKDHSRYVNFKNELRDTER
jgi:hypothetical protein